MPGLERMLYASTATGRTDSLLNMATILAESQRNNDRDGLTGALGAHDGRFIQVIEGPPGVLDGLLRRLAGDPRHRDIVILDRRPITQRQFPDWSMANSRLGPETATALDRLMKTPETSAPEIIALLRETLEAGPARDT